MDAPRNAFIVEDPPSEARDFASAYSKAIVLAKNALANPHSLSGTTSVTDELLNDYYLSTASKRLFSSFLSIDLRNFTLLSNTKTTTEISSTVVVFSKAVANIVSLTGGFVLKYVGDAVLSFYPAKEPSVSVDRALLSAAAIGHAMETVILPNFKDQGISTNFGIGIDAGEAAIIKVGSTATKMHYDLIGKAINFSVKLQSSAKRGEILATETVYRLSSYKEFFSKTTPDKHPSGVKGALLRAKNLIFRGPHPEAVFRFDPPKEGDF